LKCENGIRTKKISWLDKRSSQKNKRKQANTELYLARETSTDWPYFEIRWDGKQQVAEEFKCYMTWQSMTAVLHSTEQQRTER